MREVLGSIRIEHWLEVAMCRSRALHRFIAGFEMKSLHLEISRPKQYYPIYPMIQIIQVAVF